MRKTIAKGLLALSVSLLIYGCTLPGVELTRTCR